MRNQGEVLLQLVGNPSETMLGAGEQQWGEGWICSARHDYNICTEGAIPGAVLCYFLLSPVAGFQQQKVCKILTCCNKITPETSTCPHYFGRKGGSAGSCLRSQLPKGCLPFICLTNNSSIPGLSPANVLRPGRMGVSPPQWKQRGTAQFPQTLSAFRTKAGSGELFGEPASSGPPLCRCCSSVLPQQLRSV